MYPSLTPQKSRKPLTHPQLSLLLTLTSSLHNLHNIRASLPPSHFTLTSPDFDPDSIIKPILATNHKPFFDIFGEEYVSIWTAFNGALLLVWEWGDVETQVEVWWDKVGEAFEVGERQGGVLRRHLDAKTL